MRSEKEPIGMILLALVFCVALLVVQVVWFSRCKERGGYYAFRDMQCIVIPGAQVTP